MTGPESLSTPFESIYLVDEANLAALRKVDQDEIVSEEGRPLVALTFKLRPAVAQGLVINLTYLCPWQVLASIIGQSEEVRRIMPAARRHDFDRIVADVERGIARAARAVPH